MKILNTIYNLILGIIEIISFILKSIIDTIVIIAYFIYNGLQNPSTRAIATIVLIITIIAIIKAIRTISTLIKIKKSNKAK